jgi:hypothetical protein
MTFFNWSYTKMPRLDPTIVEHHIDTWPDISPSTKSNRPLHPSKSMAIKAKIDKLRVIGFIYPIAYTSWVSNSVPVNKKQGTIRVCTDFHDLNQACPKDNFPTPFIDQVIDACVATKFCHSWMDFLAITRFKFTMQINTKPHLQPPMEHFHIE